ncbi:DUF7948 domain-containing protein [Hymenobacter persicinus]|uniref:PKD domain-containing protein n=1 Tax=Hymenobacter persicinus TaxID=2025506 RepID=A0A4Q5LF64_9BACT|nr:gliding motility-associated C-terminal domain-containing protein [Hymenobacter persicinus]RYU81613.1 PKD domain-containing protein [Hymenobacter persicinus]
MRLLLTLSLLLSALLATAGPGPAFSFAPNQRQWPAQVRYSTTIPGGRLFFENSRFTYSIVEGSPEPHAAPAKPQPRKGHAFRMQLVGSQTTPVISGEAPSETYQNYFLGNDPQQWASHVPEFGQLRYRQVYAGIDMLWHSEADQLEYDFEVAPGADPGAIRMRYEGLDQLTLYNGQLQLHTSLGIQTEQAPVAYQLGPNGQRELVACRFRLRGQEVSFELTGTYDHQRPLIIDPTLIFCTYSGTTGGLSANCTASDAAGNVYSAGLVIGTPYPVTVGAFQVNGQVGNMGISKFSPDGRTLLYSTYLGGFGSGGPSGYSEYPLKLLVNAAGELHIVGITSANNYPVTASAYQRQLRGSQDLCITHFSASGTSLLGSTYLGGSAQEAGSLSSIPAALTLDAAGNILVGSTTTSRDYPILAGLQTVAPSLSGFTTDGFVSKLNSSLSTMIWSTYLGGGSNDQVHDIRVAANGTLYVCGQTESNNFPTTATALNRLQPGGIDGYVTNLSATGNTLLASTYLGTNNIESARFLDFDSQGRVCVAGETLGSYPVSTGAFSFSGNFNSQSVFIHCLNQTLSATAYSTRIATSNNNSFGGPVSGVTAFGMTDCDQIMFSAYASQGINQPTTSDAFSRSFRSIYLCSLNPSAQSMSYGSFFGSLNDFSTHLHPAASSQITRSGILTHIECTTASDYPTSPGVVAPIKRTFSNDGAIFKFSVNGALISDFKAAVAPVPAACAPYQVQFTNTSVGAKTYSWNFGDGSALDTARSPSHVFANAGTYQVQLIARRVLTGCGRTADTTRTTVTVKRVPADEHRTLSLNCNANLTLDAGVEAAAYEWSTGEKTRTILRVNQPGHYIVRILDPASCPYQIDFEVVQGGNPPTSSQQTIPLNCNSELILDAGTAATSYQWSTGEKTRTLQHVKKTGHYIVRIVDLSGCSYQIDFEVVGSLEKLELPNVITPNNDTFNDAFRLPGTLAGSKLKVFNRWGRMVYQSGAYANDWQGEGLPMGVYYYEVSPPSDCGGVLKGWVEIAR